MGRKKLHLLWVGLAIVGGTMGVCSAADDSYEAQQAARVSSRVDSLEKEVADLKASKGSGGGSNMFDWSWDNGLIAKTGDGNFKVKIGGRLQYDFGTISQSEENKKKFGDILNGSEFRRLRLMIDGTIYGNAFFRLEPDFAGGTAKIKDAWIGYKNLPLFGNIRVGHQKEPMGLDQLTSDNYVDFIEIAQPVNAFTPDRNWGAMLYNSQLNKRLFWAVGVFRDTDDYGSVQHDDGYSLTARIAGRPLMSEDKSNYLHLGVSGSYRKPSNGTYTVSSTPEWHMAPKFADTKSFATNSVDLYGVEAAVVLGPFDVQAEWLGAHTDQGNLNGWYIEAGWWITGEHANYDADNAVFGRVSPKNNFDPAKGTWGAFKVNARYSNLDLDAGKVKGGKVNDVSVGINWQLNPNMRIMLDGVHSMPEGKGTADMLLLRTQVDF